MRNLARVPLLGDIDGEARYRTPNGRMLGRPTVITSDARAIIRAMRRQGSSYREIAAALDAAQVPTPQGGARWYASTVRIIHTREP